MTQHSDLSIVPLDKLISFEGFDFGEYLHHEQTILLPRLEALGYSNVAFSTGESDSFGPLTRICTAKLNGPGTIHHFIYG